MQNALELRMRAGTRITLRQLELFCAAADHGSFARAAEAMYVTSNAVSLAVGELEASLDAHLCVRHRARGITLTPAGLRLRERAGELLRDANELQHSIGDSDGEGVLRGPVAIGCYSTLAATVLPSLMQGFAERHPEVDLSIVDGTMKDLLPRLRAGELDVIIAYRINMPGDISEALLYETSVHVLLPAAHPLAANESVSLDDLREDRLILLDVPPSGDHTLDMLTRAGVQPEIAHRTPNFELVRSLVGRGFGYSLLIQKPSIDVSYEGRRVVAKPIHPELSAEAAVIIWPRQMRLTDRARALVDFAVETIHIQQWRPAQQENLTE
ncbi:LysR family transcriptional regulator [Microbacterium sp. 1.5R]|uniref:LysR family transcriptional regulator n=1 Tax=Microbacterium sp. 1.5R TaxID=1916917 RepID=UPI0018DD673C|nr:LysR family transcriptional regulator [Microbacterium sp. 1.5R]